MPGVFCSNEQKMRIIQSVNQKGAELSGEEKLIRRHNGWEANKNIRATQTVPNTALYTRITPARVLERSIVRLEALVTGDLPPVRSFPDSVSFPTEQKHGKRPGYAFFMFMTAQYCAAAFPQFYSISIAGHQPSETAADFFSATDQRSACSSRSSPQKSSPSSVVKLGAPNMPIA